MTIAMPNNKQIDYKRWTFYLISLAILMRFALAFIYTVSGDACWHLSAARFISEEGKLPLFESIGRDEPFWAPPLFHFIASIFYSLFGNIGLKLVSPLFGSLCLIVGLKILRRFLNERATFYGMLFFSFIPIMMDYSVLGYGESVLTFFIILSLYFALNQRFLPSGITAGLAILSKYNGVIIIPALVWMAYVSKERWKNLSSVTILPLIIAVPWFVRNFLVLGNPIWPFLNFMFEGIAQKAYSIVSLSNLWSLKTWQALYLGFFGVPDGNMASLSLINLPFFTIAFGLFLLGTVLFSLPLLFGWKKGKEEVPLYLLLAGSLAIFLLYVATVGPFVSRMLLPAFIALAVVYGRGAEIMITKKREKFMCAVSILLALGFAIAVLGKFTIARSAWSVYHDDFEWVKQNTPRDAVFLAGGQCVQFHLERASVFPSANQGYQYVWINDGFFLDKRSILNKERTQEELSKSVVVYENKSTKTAILKRIS